MQSYRSALATSCDNKSTCLVSSQAEMENRTIASNQKREWKALSLTSKTSQRHAHPEQSSYELDLEKLLESASARAKLCIEVLSADTMLSRKARFCGAVQEYKKIKDKLEKKSKARKIVSMFIQNGSLFQIDNLPAEYA